MSSQDPIMDMPFEELIKDITENPEKIYNITEEQALAYQKKLNPYSYVAKNMGNASHKRAVAASYTNLREDYIRRFTMTSMVGYLFCMLKEWDVPTEVRRWKPLKLEKPSNWTPDDIIKRANGLQSIATIAKDAVEEAAECTKKANIVNDAIKSIKQTKCDNSTDEEARLQELNDMEKTVSVLFKSADTALAKSRGLQYVAMLELTSMGQDSSERIDDFAQIACQHPEVRDIIKQHKCHNQMEMPADIAKNIFSCFLRTWFEYNPDAHVRSAYDEFVINKDVIDGIDTADPGRITLSDINKKSPSFSTDEDRKIYTKLTASREVHNAASCMFRNEDAAKAFCQACESQDSINKYRRYLSSISEDSPTRTAIDIIPPQDTFHRWNYYIEVNYEELRAATEAIYHEKPDLDWAFIIYEYFEGSTSEVDAAFEDFRNKHQDEIISDIKGFDLGGWTLLGDFKENRAKTSFYNKHTDIIKRILDRHAEDKKLGQDLMRNRVRQLKAKNIREDGPDAAGLDSYKTQNTNKNLSSMGAERVISREEMYRLERARGNIRAAQELNVIDKCKQTIEELSATAKVRTLLPEEAKYLKNAQTDLILAQEMIEVPDDAIQIDVWSHDSTKGTFNKSKFYTKAEAPDYINKAPQESNQEVTKVADLAPYAQDVLANEIETTRHK